MKGFVVHKKAVPFVSFARERNPPLPFFLVRVLVFACVRVYIHRQSGRLLLFILPFSSLPPSSPSPTNQTQQDDYPRSHGQGRARRHAALPALHQDRHHGAVAHHPRPGRLHHRHLEPVDQRLRLRLHLLLGRWRSPDLCRTSCSAEERCLPRKQALTLTKPTGLLVLDHLWRLPGSRVQGPPHVLPHRRHHRLRPEQHLLALGLGLGRLQRQRVARRLLGLRLRRRQRQQPR